MLRLYLRSTPDALFTDYCDCDIKRVAVAVLSRAKGNPSSTLLLCSPTVRVGARSWVHRHAGMACSLLSRRTASLKVLVARLSRAFSSCIPGSRALRQA